MTTSNSYYSAKTAQKYYEELLVDSRIGISRSHEEIKRSDDILKPLVNKGHSVHHILANNKDTIMFIRDANDSKSITESA